MRLQEAVLRAEIKEARERLYQLECRLKAITLKKEKDAISQTAVTVAGLRQ